MTIIEKTESNDSRYDAFKSAMRDTTHRFHDDFKSAARRAGIAALSVAMLGGCAIVPYGTVQGYAQGYSDGYGYSVQVNPYAPGYSYIPEYSYSYSVPGYSYGYSTPGYSF